MVVLGHIGTGAWGIRLLQMMNRFATVKSCYGHQNIDLIPKGVRVVKNVDEIIYDNTLNGTVIATSPETHYELSKKCLKSGHHIFVEKPMCLTVKEAQDLIDLARANKLKIMVGFIYLYSDEYLKIKRNFHNINNIKAYFMQTKFRHPTPSLTNLGSHFVALALDFYDENPTDVKVEGNDDSGIISIDFGNKKAEVHASRVSKSKKREVIFMEDGKVIYHWDILKINHENDNPLLNECKHFVECLKTNSTPRTNGLVGLKTTKLIMGELS